MTDAFSLVDTYLAMWDEFAQGDNRVLPYLRDNKWKFENALAGLLRSGERGAPARLVFYAVVRVGGAIPIDSELGREARAVLGEDFPVMTTKEGERVLFCADLYAWWEEHEGEFDHFLSFDAWLGRDFATERVADV